MIRAAFTIYGFVVAKSVEERDYVLKTGHNEGVDTADFDLSAMGLDTLLDSGKKCLAWSKREAHNCRGQSQEFWTLSGPCRIEGLSLRTRYRVAAGLS